MKHKIYTFLFDGFSDWEIAYLSPEISKSTKYDLIYFSKNGRSVRSMGGMQVVPDTSLAEIQIGDVHMLILPGGTAWEEGKNREIDPFVTSLFTNGTLIAAICAATVYLGQLGFLNHVDHTSNDLAYLKEMAPQYSGEQRYLNAWAVMDEHLITANGVAPIEFARCIFEALDVYDHQDIERWYQLFKHGVWSE